MKKKVFYSMFVGALLTTANMSLVSCSDYDDDIKGLQEQINALVTQDQLAAKAAELRDVISKAQTDFDERITVVNLLLSGLTVVFSDVARERKMVQLWYEFLKEYRKSQRSPEEQHALYNSAVEQFSKNMEILKESSLILPKEYYIRQDVLRHIKGDFDTVMDDFTEESEKLSTMEDAAGEKLNHAFDFVEDVFSDGQEMLVFVTELTITPEISSFLAENECEKFDIYNEKLMVGSNRTKLLKELER